MAGPQKWEFDAPYTATFRDGMYGKWLELLSNGFTVASFSVNDFGDEQACIEAAWNYAYGFEPIDALEELVEVSERAVRLSKEHDNFKLYAMEPMERAIAAARAAIAKAKGEA
jgi:hypothetical protein